MSNDIEFKFSKPIPLLSDFVESFWLLKNHANVAKEVVILPDGRIDMTFSQAPAEPFRMILSGIETRPDRAILAAKTCMFAISFKLLATECIIHDTVASFLDSAIYLPADFWDFQADDLHDFDLFCQKAAHQIQNLLPKEIDRRKQKLFDLVYATNGAISVQELSGAVFWSSRQINRYFQQQFGLSLKAYCNILRFRASFQHIKEGKLFPQENFADQSHFIKEVKKLAGVSPKELKQNQNDRFIQFSTLPTK